MIWLLLGVALFFGILVWVLQPVFSRSGMAVAVDEDRRELRARRDQRVAELQELELDRELGRLEDAEYAAQRSRAEAELALILRELGEVGPAAPGSGDAERSDGAGA